MGAAERRKGAVAEREIVNILRDFGWKNARRTSDGRDQNARGDIVNGPEGCLLEVKRHERLNVGKALSQAIGDAPACDVPIVVHRPSRHEWMATLPLDELLPLLALRERG